MSVNVYLCYVKEYFSGSRCSDFPKIPELSIILQYNSIVDLKIFVLPRSSRLPCQVIALYSLGSFGLDVIKIGHQSSKS